MSNEVKNILLQQGFSPLKMEIFMQMYTQLSYPGRQACAVQLDVDPTLAQLTYELLNNKQQLNTNAVDAAGFVRDELSIVAKHLTT